MGEVDAHRCFGAGGAASLIILDGVNGHSIAKGSAVIGAEELDQGTSIGCSAPFWQKAGDESL